MGKPRLLWKFKHYSCMGDAFFFRQIAIKLAEFVKSCFASSLTNGKVTCTNYQYRLFFFFASAFQHQKLYLFPETTKQKLFVDNNMHQGKKDSCLWVEKFMFAVLMPFLVSVIELYPSFLLAQFSDYFCKPAMLAKVCSLAFFIFCGNF